MHGKGIVTLKNRYQFKGKWKNGYKTGYGKINTVNGGTFKG